MNKTKKHTLAALFALVCALVLTLSLGVMSACGNESAETESGAWYYGAAVPSEFLGQEGDYYLNTTTLASYKKTADGWSTLSVEEGSSWLYGTGVPTEEEGSVSDFYLNTKTGDLYQKGESGWGEPILKLFGTNGDGVMWFSGEAEPKDSSDLALKALQEGDFYLQYPDFVVWQYAKQEDDTLGWKKLGTLKGEAGESGVVVGWTVGAGKPAADTAVGEEGFYLDSESGDIYQKTAEETWALKGSLGNLSASHIKSITYNSRYYGKSHWKGKILNPLDQLGGNVNTVAGDTAIYGYWFEFDNGMALFVSAGDCRHTSGYSADDRYYLYDNDCEKGTVYWQKCKFCGEWSLVTKEATEDAAHPMNTDDWKHNETQHWHESVCSHRAVADKADHEYFTYATFEVGEGDEVQTGKYTVWYECSVCGYKYAQPSLDALKGTDGVYHIRTVQEWNSLSTKFNAGKVSTVSMAGVRVIASSEEVTVSLDADLDFRGAALKPLGTAENPFKGTFKGNHHSIGNFTVSGAYAGLFGMTENATVQELTIVGAEVTAAGEGSRAGVLAAEAKGTLTVKDVNVLESAAASAGDVTDAAVGGLVGKLTDGSVSVEGVNVDCAGVENHAQGTEGSALVGGGGTVTFAGENEVGYTIAEGFVEKHYKTGSQTTSVVYEISSVKGLEGFRDNVNGEGEFAEAGPNNYAGKTVRLMNDLDFEGFDGDGKVIEKNIWWGNIGNGSYGGSGLGAGNTNWSGKSFNGTFDGNNKTIKNVCMGYDNLSSSPNSKRKPSLFGGLVNATVKNLNFEHVEAGKSPRSGFNGFGVLAMCLSGGTISGVTLDRIDITGGGFMSALCGMAFNGSIDHVTLKDSTITCGSSIAACVGGLVGRGSAIFSDCTVQGCTFNVSGDMVGGIVGQWSARSTGGTAKTMKNVTVKDTHIAFSSSQSAAMDIGLVVGYLYRAANNTDLFETVNVENCSVSAELKSSTSSMINSFTLRDVGGVVGSTGTSFAVFGGNGTAGDIGLSFKDVHVKGLTLSSCGSITYAGGIFGGRCLFRDGMRPFGNVTLSFEDCSVESLTMVTGTRFEHDNAVTSSGYFVGSVYAIDVYGLGSQLPETGTVTVKYVGTNTYQPTVESLSVIGMGADQVTSEGDPAKEN